MIMKIQTIVAGTISASFFHSTLTHVDTQPLAAAFYIFSSMFFLGVALIISAMK